MLLSEDSTPEQGVIDTILERKNSLIRPPVANLDRLFIIASSVEPTLNLFITDKMVAIAEDKGIEPVAVSYTHLDVYKRQLYFYSGWL